MKTPVKFTFLIAALSLGSGCATLQGLFSSDENPHVSYGEDAEANLALGNEAIEGKNFAEAQKYFDYVKSKYPYLDAAKLAELRLADTDFARERYMEARDRYLGFIKLHPSHAQVDYAAFRAALSYYKDIPSDYFFLPPSKEKDQVNLRSALTSMKDFVRTHPGSQYQAEAKTVLDDVKRRLADHELYVAAFYAKRDKWPAVISRLQIVARDFPDLGLDEKVYFGLYDAWLQLKDEAKAKEALQTLVSKDPNTDAAKKAARLLAPKG